MNNKKNHKFQHQVDSCCYGRRPGLCLLSCLLFLFVFTSCTEKNLEADHFASKGIENRERELKRGRALYLKGRTGEALGVFEELYHRYPGDVEICTAYVRSLLYSGDPAAALGAAETLEDAHMDRSVDLLKLSAESAMLLEKYEKAEGLLERGLGISSEDTRLILLLARCRKAEGRYDEAMALLESAVFLSERNVEIYLELARIYGEYGLKNESRSALEKARYLLGKDHPLVPALMDTLRSLGPCDEVSASALDSEGAPDAGGGAGQIKKP